MSAPQHAPGQPPGAPSPPAPEATGSILSLPGEAPPALLALTRAVAALGGATMLAAAFLVTVSVLGRWANIGPVPGDFELVQLSTALGVFSFFAYIQARRGNIVVDSLTGRLPKVVTRGLDAMWDLVWAGFAALIAWRLFIGAGEAATSGTTTMMLAMPIAPAIYVASVLAGLLAVTGFITAFMLLRSLK
jgi:TRAP-type C4-dicarboxylate transport system permease small subunit